MQVHHSFQETADQQKMKTNWPASFDVFLPGRSANGLPFRDDVHIQSVQGDINNWGKFEIAHCVIEAIEANVNWSRSGPAHSEWPYITWSALETAIFAH